MQHINTLVERYGSLQAQQAGSASWLVERCITEKVCNIFWLAEKCPLAILFYRCHLSFGQPSPNFAICSMVTHIHKIQSEIWVTTSSEILRPKARRFRYFIVNISGTQQDIVNRKMALQTTYTSAQANLIRCTLVHKLRK